MGFDDTSFPVLTTVKIIPQPRVASDTLVCPCVAFTGLPIGIRFPQPNITVKNKKQTGVIVVFDCGRALTTLNETAYHSHL